MKKKGNVNKLTGLVFTLVVFALLLAIGFIIMGTIANQETTSVTATVSTVQAECPITPLYNVSLNITGGVGACAKGDTCTGLSILNSSTVNVTDKFTITNCLINLTDLSQNNTVHSVDYVASNQTTQATLTTTYNATTEMISHVSTTPSWIPLIIVAFVGGFVLVMFLRSQS